MRSKIILLIFILVPVWVWSQFSVFSLDARYEEIVERQLLKDSIVNLSVHPLICFDADNTYQIGLRWCGKFAEYLFDKNNFDYQNEDFSMHLNLLGNYSKGTVKKDSTDYYRNTRGFEIWGNLGEKIFYYTKFLENQAVFVPYIDDYIDTMVVVPGEGWWKPFGERGRDFLYAYGYLNFNPLKNLYLELGHGKNFIGSGYRSLILSDNSFVYPYFKLYYTQGHFSFYALWMENYVFKQRYYFYHYPKHSTYNVFSYLNKNFNVSFVIATQWKTSDYHTYVNHFKPYFFIPFTAPLVYGLDGENNVLLGWDFNFHYRTFVLYGQAVVDKVNFKEKLLSTDNRFGYQVGIRTYDLLFGKFKFMSVRALAEYNCVRPYVYASQFRNQGFYHYNQALAHPLGSGFKELVLRTRLRLWNVFIDYAFSNALQEPQVANIFTTNQQFYENFLLGKENPQRIMHSSLTVSFMINSHTGLRFFTGFDRRFYNKASDNYESFYKFVGLKTDLGRFYYDF